MRRPARCGRAVLLVVFAAALTAGCGAASAPATGASTPTPTTLVSSGPVSSGPVSSGPVVVAADGVLLRSLGIANGPVDALSLPRTTVFSSIVDTPGGVSLVLSAPTAVEVYDYLRRELPAAGFTMTAQAPAAQTLTFTGRGWAGSLTGAPRVCALLLRPA